MNFHFGADILARNGINSSYLPTQKRVLVAKLSEELGATINYKWSTPHTQGFESIMDTLPAF